MKVESNTLHFYVQKLTSPKQLSIKDVTHLSLGLVADKKVDFAPNVFRVRNDRAKAVDYLISNKYVGRGWFYIKNPGNTNDWTVFLKPMYGEAWIGFSCVLLLHSVVDWSNCIFS